ncbi:MAG: N-formylglutamate amidohydrolase [Rufibacter sp.]
MATFILTCEHAGNEVPAPYDKLFEGKEEVLYSHKGIDFGALRLAKQLAAELSLPLYYTTISRLLVEHNRSLDSGELFSEFSKKLSKNVQQEVLEKYYFPHRQKVEAQVKEAVEKGEKVVHLAIHTFTPAKDGEIREAEIGILFDPERSFEKGVADLWKEELLQQDPALKVLFNSPYPGKDDGLPTYLRTKFTDNQYAGFELEINQKFFLDGEPAVWQKVVNEMTEAVRELSQNL